MPDEATETRSVWLDAGMLHMRERILVVAAAEADWLRDKLRERHEDSGLSFANTEVFFDFEVTLDAAPWNDQQRARWERERGEALKRIQLLRPYYSRSTPKTAQSPVYLPGFDRTASPPFFPIDQGGGKGYVDRTGRIVHPTTLAEAQIFSEGLAWIRRGDDWYAIGEDGSYRVHLKFNDVHEAWPFSCGWARFTRGISIWHDGGPRGEDWYEFEGKYYLVRSDGVVLNRAFDWAGDFVDGVVRVHDGVSEQWLDTEGLPVPAPDRKQG
jgi:hypothetical protein